MSEKTAAQGVVALLIGNDGRVIASATDFDTSVYGGFSLRQAQEMRAKSSLVKEAMTVLASPLICSAIDTDTYGAEKIVQSMCSLGGCRIEIVAVGHES